MYKPLDYLAALVAILMILGPLAMAPGYGPLAAGLPAQKALPPATPPDQPHH